MISEMSKEQALYYIKIVSALSFLFSAFFSLDYWTNGGHFLLGLPLPFYFFVFSAAIFSLTSLAK